MRLADLLKRNRDTIIENWFDAVAGSYPSDTSKHLKNQTDQFHNPVGHTLKKRLPVLVDVLLGEVEDTLDVALHLV